jgi:hypothetical protein
MPKWQINITSARAYQTEKEGNDQRINQKYNTISCNWKLDIPKRRNRCSAPYTVEGETSPLTSSVY